MIDAFYRDRRVLVTGGAGFIGSRLVRELVRLGSRVTVQDALLPESGGSLDNLREVAGAYTFHQTDTRDAEGTAACVRGQDVVFNIAGQPSHVRGMQEPLEDLDINARGAINVLEGCRRDNPGARVVYCSSRQVYGRPHYLPVDEEHPIDPVDAYGISKHAGERYHLMYGRAYGLWTTVLRLTNTYGPRQNRFDFVGVFMRRAAAGQPLVVFGDGSQVRDFNHVDDACHAMLLAGMHEETRGRVFNLGAAERCSIREFADRLAALAGVEIETVPYPPGRKEIEIGTFYADFSRFRQATGWAPRVMLEDGLRETFASFRAAESARR